MSIGACGKWIHDKVTLRHSIRHRITAVFVCLMAFMLLAIWAINNFWLEHYYVSQKRDVMEAAYSSINGVVMAGAAEGKSVSDILLAELNHEWEVWGNGGKQSTETEGKAEEDAGTETAADADGSRNSVQTTDAPTLLGSIRTYGDQNNITTVLIDSYTGSVLLRSDWETDFLVRKVQQYILGRKDEDSRVLKQGENYVIELNYDYRTNATYLESWGYFSDNKTLFIMSMPLDSVRESVGLSSRFITYVGLAVLVLGSILMYFVTNQVTKPILKLASLSEEMSRLNFNVRYEADAQDETGVLGRSMNTLSERLKETIGALKEANIQLQHDIEEKVQIDEMRKEFIANVSHELKTPIALIQGYAEGLTEGMCEDEESRNYYCEVIMDEANKMNRMVKQLLTLSALEFGRDTPVMEVFSIGELIRDLVNSSAILIQQHEASVTVDVPEEVWVLGDEFKIEEVLTNYLTNAMNHLDGERQIKITAARERDTVTVSVYNTGSPIPEEDIPNLWTKFFKVDKARTRAYGGSGIGLSIVKAIMDAHHQRCGAANTEDGVVFWFTLKAVEKQEENCYNEHE
ncbi:MAG: HAMP domain-containing sensor histidine kinase [Eubacteriales bacterium]|nr:HAMP domain-containing sensor histidine kinase [Eubacteriales bacterium]